MHALLALRGYDEKKHVDAWREGVLHLKPGELKLQGTAQKWRRSIKEGEVWNAQLVAPCFSAPSGGMDCGTGTPADGEVDGLSQICGSPKLAPESRHCPHSDTERGMRGSNNECDHTDSSEMSLQCDRICSPDEVSEAHPKECLEA